MARVIQVSSLEEKNQLMDYLRAGSYPERCTDTAKRSIRRKASNFCLVGDHLCFKTPAGLTLRVVFMYETEFIELILKEAHEDGHPGMNKMVDLINRKYYGIETRIVRNYIRSCAACSNFNSLATVQPIQFTEIISKYDRFMMDCVDLRRYSDMNDGYCWILNVIDTFTKYIWSFKMLNKTAESVKQNLEYIFCNFGVPRSIQSDNGKEFSNLLLKNYLIQLNVQIIHGRPRHPQAQGQIERANQTLKRWLAKSLHESGSNRWINILDKIVHKYNLTIHRATGRSPFMLFHGQNGFNGPISDLEVVETESGLNALSQHNLIESSQSDRDGTVYNLEYVPELDRVSTQIEIHEPSHSIQILSDLNEHNDVREHFERYRDASMRSSNQNLVNRQVAIGDLVLIRMDFDNNVQTRRYPLSSFFENDKYEVLQFLSNNMIELKNTLTNQVCHVHARQIKKI